MMITQIKWEYQTPGWDTGQREGSGEYTSYTNKSYSINYIVAGKVFLNGVHGISYHT